LCDGIPQPHQTAVELYNFFAFPDVELTDFIDNAGNATIADKNKSNHHASMTILDANTGIGLENCGANDDDFLNAI
jgi:hypothetical protein